MHYLINHYGFAQHKVVSNALVKTSFRPFLVGFFLLLSIPQAWSADDYESLLDAEVKKVETRKIDGESGTNTVEAPAETSTQGAAGKAQTGTSRDQFEGMLQKKYLGTFGFYKKLPERTRQEIYLDYSKGASLTKIRKKIIDRILQR